jgi:nucleoside phosphorylase
MPQTKTPPFYAWLLISALPQESAALLQQYRHTGEKTPQGYTLFRFQNQKMSLLEIGSGNKFDRNKFKSGVLQIKPDFIINFGICGALSQRIELHKNYLVRSVSYENKTVINLSYNLDLLRLLSHPQALLQSVPLLTVKDPVLNSRRRDKLQQITACMLVDMEGYFIAQIAHELDIPVAILKHVTDNADQGAMQQIKRTKKIWQQSLYQGLIEILNL